MYFDATKVAYALAGFDGGNFVGAPNKVNFFLKSAAIDKRGKRRRMSMYISKGWICA